MPVVRRGSYGKSYYYRYARIDGQRQRKYVGKAGNPQVQAKIRREQLDAVEKTLELARRVKFRKRLQQSNETWTLLLKVLESWRLLQLGCQDGLPDPAQRLIKPYPWKASPLSYGKQVEQLLLENNFTKEQIKQLCTARANHKLAEVPDAVSITTQQQSLWFGAIELLSICRDDLYDSITKDCVLTRANIQVSIDRLNLENGYLTAVNPVERLLIEVISLAYFEAMSAGGLCFEMPYSVTYANRLSRAANQSTRRFTKVFEILEEFRHEQAILNGAPRKRRVPVKARSRIYQPKLK